jgi:hypothetical protein
MRQQQRAGDLDRRAVESCSLIPVAFHDASALYRPSNQVAVEDLFHDPEQVVRGLGSLASSCSSSILFGSSDSTQYNSSCS